MRLRAIEAARYGALENGCLNDLGDGLTVVLGPNESGKSTFTALTRHVLYGYPDGRAKERGYEPPAGSRLARLVFASEGGEWAIERVDGARRGPVRVIARSGAERPGLLGEIVGGVSEQTYRIVFGFGLDELAEIEGRENADVVSRLYAAGTGLSVNPIDVRKDLANAAGELYAPRGQKPRVNDLARRAKDARERIRELEAVANEFAAETKRLAELGDVLEPLRAKRDELDIAARSLERSAQRANDALEQHRALTDSLEQAEAAVEEVRRRLEVLVVDEAALAAEPAARTVLADASAFRERLNTIASLEAQAEDAERRVATLGELSEDASDSPELRAAVENWRERLGDARRVAESKRQAAVDAEARLAGTEAVASKAATVKPSREKLALGGVLALFGAIAAVAGAFTEQIIAALLGGVVLVAGGIFALLGARPTANQPLSEDSARLRAEVAAARLAAEHAEAEYGGLLDEWRAWLAERSLDRFGDDPKAVIGLLDRLRDRDAIVAERERALAAVKRERETAEAWVVRLVDVAGAIDPALAQIPALPAALELAERVRITVDRAQGVATERAGLAAQLSAAEAQRDSIAKQRGSFAETIATIAREHGVDAEHAADLLATQAESTAEERDDTRDQVETIMTEMAGLRARLDSAGRDDAMALARQELESLRAEAASAADRYLVTELAVRLIDRARERFERERQPEVVHTAARVFSAMTDGRYRNLRVPLDDSGITVVAEDGTVRSTRELSRGTAEQLYLALRVGLIGSLGELGRSLPVLMDDVVVNFDPERRAGAVAAIAELASARQVLYFTCHPETAEALRDRVPGATLVTLDRCSIGA